MAGFYIPLFGFIEKVPVIIYPCIGVESLFDRNSPGILEDHLLKLYTKNPELHTAGQYHIVLMWDLDSDDPNSQGSKDKMTDVWIFDQVESWGSGPLVDAKIFRNFSIEKNIGISAGDGLIMLGREEEHRRTKSSLGSYLEDPRPQLPEYINPSQEFYI